MTRDDIIRMAQEAGAIREHPEMLPNFWTLTNPDLERFANLVAPPKKEWVGLTDDEIWKDDGIMAANSGYGANFETLRELARAIETKLKDKNT